MWFSTLMNICNMSFQINIECKTWFTNVAFVCFVFQIHIMFFNELFAVKLISQIVHICGFWPSCTVAICCFNELLIYWKCSITKSTFFFFLSWTNATCIFKSMAHEKIMALVRITQVKTHLLVSFVPKKSNATYLNWHFMSSGAI